MKFKIRINPVAIADVQEIIAYIAEDNPAAAERIGKEIYSKVEKLADFPQIGVSLSSRINMLAIAVDSLRLSIKTKAITANFRMLCLRKVNIRRTSFF
ncbi:MAG: type II toxin-antitoxin system RelE/ParE family toxin [Desulfitobacteriaceae bacterium]